MGQLHESEKKGEEEEGTAFFGHLSQKGKRCPTTNSLLRNLGGGKPRGGVPSRLSDGGEGKKKKKVEENFKSASHRANCFPRIGRKSKKKRVLIILPDTAGKGEEKSKRENL